MGGISIESGNLPTMLQRAVERKRSGRRRGSILTPSGRVLTRGFILEILKVRSPNHGMGSALRHPERPNGITRLKRNEVTTLPLRVYFNGGCALSFISVSSTFASSMWPGPWLGDDST